MKKLLLIALVLLASCSEPKQQLPPPKYKLGDIVYTKPDSTKSVVTFIYSEYPWYIVDYTNKQGKREHATVEEFEIY